MPLRQYPNRRTTTSGHPRNMVMTGGFGHKVASKVRTTTTSMTKNSTRPTIRGWQNYTGRTMGPVGQFSRVPGFGRKFRG